MQSSVNIGVIGDFKLTNSTHLATNAAIAHAADVLEIRAEIEWGPTLQIEKKGSECLRAFDALWCSPGSPYESMEGALDAIRFAREANLPFLGT